MQGVGVRSPDCHAVCRLASPQLLRLQARRVRRHPCGTTALAAEANNIQKVSHVREKMSEYAGAAELAFAAGVAAAMYGEKTASGMFFPNAIFANVGRRMMGEN